MKSYLIQFYNALVFRHPYILGGVLLLTVIIGICLSSQFRLDASADALVLENDPALRYFREISARYDTEDALFVVYRPIAKPLFDRRTLADIAELQDALKAAVPRLSQVLTLLDVPLVDSPRVSLMSLASGVRTLRAEDTDLALAKRELTTGPAYGNNLVSADGSVTALVLNFERDPEYYRLLEARNSLRRLKLERPLTQTEETTLTQASQAFSEYQMAYTKQRRADIALIREQMSSHSAPADLFLGGVSMIASDMVDFIQRDLILFGSSILLFLLVTLAVLFRQLCWILLPLLCCLITALLSIALLGALDWPVTVISANFVSLLSIITLSMTIHLIVRYRELQSTSPSSSHLTRIQDTVQQMAMPCFYMTITTVVAFASLVVSGIRPVIDFGYMMMSGVAIAFVVVFLLFPLGLQRFTPSPAAAANKLTETLTSAIAGLALRYKKTIVALCSFIAVIALLGITKLEVENRFIDYFKSDTEIRRGMEIIDRKLGGTTPLEVIIDADPAFFQEESKGHTPNSSAAHTRDEEDWLLQAYTDDELETPPSYWLNPDALNRLENVHDYLESLPEVGKVMSLATAMKIIRMVNQDQPLSDFELAILHKKMPPEMQATLLKPYLSEDTNQVRIVMRVIDSDKTLRRDELIQRIHKQLVDKFGFAPEQVHTTGMLVLYNNMLQSLFSSQILTLGVVMLAIMAMFLILFRSLAIAIVGILPNVLAAITVLGLMGWLGIPLDLMTITIAAIAIGIAVDDAIHYLYRFGVEWDQVQQYSIAVQRSHASIGKAMYFTSLTIIIGFSILVLSNFIPSVYFGVLASLAMLIALVCNLVFLPCLIILLKPFGREPKPAQAC